MQALTGEETLALKRGYERGAESYGVRICRYHADNGRYGNKSFCDLCDATGQELSFCGVDAHHQNGIAENKTKMLTLNEHTLLLNAKHHWPEHITTMLWPYALLAAADRLNCFDLDENG
eukprot:10484352-Ditylum_brightwellii.AAC.1